MLTDNYAERIFRCPHFTFCLNRYDSCDKIRLPTKLYVNDLDDNVIKVDALDEFEEMKEMQVLGVCYDSDIPVTCTGSRDI